MEIRKIRDLNDHNTFYQMIKDQYTDYTDPRISDRILGAYSAGGELIGGVAITRASDHLNDPQNCSINIDHIMVKPEWRGQGIGEELLETVINDYGDVRIDLAVSSMDDAQRLISWYEGHDFVINYSFWSDTHMTRNPKIHAGG